MSNGKKEWQDCYYICPVCKQPLTPTINGLFCQQDGVEYPVKNEIPDFVVEDLTESPSLLLRSIDKLDNIAKIYEGSVYGAWDMVNAQLDLPSIKEMATIMTEAVDAENGVGLDVACGTGFITRSIAQKMYLVYGIDISMGMLEKATEYAQERGIVNICFARSRAERLPFPDTTFDGVTCSVALHLFPDTAEALREMARVMKTGARVAVLTLVKQDPSTLKMMQNAIKMVLERVGTSSPFGEETPEALRIGEEVLGTQHLFDVKELERYLSQTGFRGFAYTIYGSFILFHAEKE